MRGKIRNLKAKVLPYLKQFNWIMAVNLSLFAVILALGTYYLVQVNNLAITGYSIRDYENQIYELEDENHRLELVIAQKQSIYEVKDKVAELDLEPVNYLEYFRASEVAKR